MSVRGIEIHNGEVVFPEGMPQTLHIGTETTPLTQGEAGQIVISAVINAIALGGDVEAGAFIVNATISMTGSPRALYAKMDIEAGVVVTGYTRGAFIETNINALGESTSYWSVLKLDMWADATAIVNQLSAIYLSNYVQVQPIYRYTFLDVRENAAVTVDCFAYVGIGAAADITNLFVLPSLKTAWSHATPPPGAVVGRIAVEVGGVQRYIGLYN